MSSNIRILKLRKGIAIAVLFILIAGLLFVARIFPAYDFLRSYRDRLSLEYPHKLAPKREIRIEEAGLGIRYYFRGDFDSTVILVPGLHPFGIDDPRFATFAEVVAETGFNVIAPDLAELRNFQLTNHVVRQLVQLIKALPRYVPESSLRNLGIVGISFGAGPAFLVASDPSVKDRLDFLVSIGGYSNLPRVLSLAMEGADPWGRMILVSQYLEQWIEDPDATVLKESLGLRLHLKEKAAELREKDLSENGKRMLKEILEGLSPSHLAQLKEHLQRKESQFAPLSPEAVLGDLNPKIRIYLLHGKSDALIPYEETLELERKLRVQGRAHVKTLIAGTLLHVEFSEDKPGFLDKLRLLLWTRAFLDEAGIK